MASDLSPPKPVNGGILAGLKVIILAGPWDKTLLKFACKT